MRITGTDEVATLEAEARSALRSSVKGVWPLGASQHLDAKLGSATLLAYALLKESVVEALKRSFG